MAAAGVLLDGHSPVGSDGQLCDAAVIAAQPSPPSWGQLESSREGLVRTGLYMCTQCDVHAYLTGSMSEVHYVCRNLHSTLLRT